MDKYEVRLMNQALQDLDEIYGHIVSNLQELGVAAELLDNLVAGIPSIPLFRASHRRLCKQRVSTAHGKELHRYLPN